MDKDQLIEQGEIPFSVTKDVVGHLSFGLYSNFARAIKELISRSYDPDSDEVKIYLVLNE